MLSMGNHSGYLFVLSTPHGMPPPFRHGLFDGGSFEGMKFQPLTGCRRLLDVTSGIAYLAVVMFQPLTGCRRLLDRALNTRLGDLIAVSTLHGMPPPFRPVLWLPYSPC